MGYDKERYANDPDYRAMMKAARKAWAQANKDKVNASARERRANNPKFAEAHRSQQLRQKYGITIEVYDAMVARQRGRCAVCQRRPIGRLCVDHSHDTQMLRRLLCHDCNLGFGKFRDNPNLMRIGADYLEIWRIIHARKLAAGFKPIPIKTSKPKKRKDTRCRPTSSPMKNPKPRA